MNVHKRRRGERLNVGPNLEVVVVDIDGDSVRLGVMGISPQTPLPNAPPTTETQAGSPEESQFFAEFA